MTVSVRQAFLLGYAYAVGYIYGRCARLAQDENDRHDPKTGRFAPKGAGNVKGGTKRLKKYEPKVLPTSSNINTSQEAKQYFDENLKGEHHLIIHRKAGLFLVDVNMNQNGSHAYTSDPKKTLTKGHVSGRRVFDKERARLMENILNIISYPTSIKADYNEDIFLDRMLKDGAQVVVLKWNSDKKKYDFRSSHKWSLEYLKRKKRYLVPATLKGIKIEETD